MKRFLVTGAAVVLAMVAGQAAAMGGSAPPPAPVQVERAAPARPGHEGAAGAPTVVRRDTPATHLEYLCLLYTSPSPRD